MDEATFLAAVDCAEEIIRERFEKWKADSVLCKASVLKKALYDRRRGRLQEAMDIFVTSLLEESKKSPVAWDAITKVAIEQIQYTGRLDGELQSWVEDILKDQLSDPAEQLHPRPKRQGKNPDELRGRNVTIGWAIRNLTKPPWSLKPTRRRKLVGNTCTLDGGSASDAAGMAWNGLGKHVRGELTTVNYATVAGIWHGTRTKIGYKQRARLHDKWERMENLKFRTNELERIK